MNEEHNDCALGAPVMEGAEKPPHIELGDNLDDALMGMLKIGYIVERKNYACYELNSKKKKGNTASVIPYFIFVMRDKFLFRKMPDFVKIVSF
jgi:hypothetical protein